MKNNNNELREEYKFKFFLSREDAVDALMQLNLLDQITPERADQICYESEDGAYALDLLFNPEKTIIGKLLADPDYGRV